MNRLQANICLVFVTLFWAAEVIIYACIPDGVPEFATMSVASLSGTALKLVFTLLLGLLIPAGIITRIELTPPVVVGTAFVLAGSLAKMIDFGAKRR